MSVTFTRRKLQIGSKPQIVEEKKSEELSVESQVQDTIRKSLMIEFLFSRITYIINYLSRDVSSPERQSTDELLKEQKSLIQQCISPLVEMYYTNFNDSLHILNEIYHDFSGTQERIADLYTYTQKVSEIINSKKEGLQEQYLQKLKMQYLLDILRTVDKIKGAITVIESYENQKKYIAATDYLIEIESLLKTSPFCDFNSFGTIQQNILEKKRALQLQLYDRLFKLVNYDDDESLYKNYINTFYNEEITSDVEALLVVNGEYTCSPETIISIYITALTKLGYCHEVETNLKTTLYNKLISIYTTMVKAKAEEKAKEEKERDLKYFKELTQQLIHVYEIITSRHFKVLEEISKCIQRYSHIVENTLDSEYSSLYVSHTIQKALITYLNKFIQPMGAMSTTLTPTTTNTRSSMRSQQLSYRFIDSTAWMNNVSSREDVKKLSSIYTDICECSVLNIVYVYQDLSIFYGRLEDMRSKRIEPKEEEESPESDFVNLKDYISNFVKTSLCESYSDVLKDYLTLMCNEGTAFQESSNKLYFNVMNMSIDFYRRFIYISKQILSLNDDYIHLVPSLSRYFSGYSAKINQYLDDTLKNTYSYKRFIWLNQDGYELYRSEPEYMDIETELGTLNQPYTSLSNKRKKEKEQSLESDMFNLCVEPAIREGDFIPNDLICKCLLLMNSVFWTIQQIEGLMNSNQVDIGYPIKESQSAFTEKVIQELYNLKDLYLKLLFILRLEIRTRVYYYIQRIPNEDITISASHVNEAAPPTYMYNLYNDLNVLLSLYIKFINSVKFQYLCTALTDFLPTLLIKSVARLNVSEWTPALINSYTQASVTVQQIFRLYMKPEQALQKIQHLLNFIKLMDSSTEEIQQFIREHPREFSASELSSLYKYSLSTRPSDLGAIDWITKSIHDAKKQQKSKKH